MFRKTELNVVLSSDDLTFNHTTDVQSEQTLLHVTDKRSYLFIVITLVSQNEYLIDLLMFTS